jgi:vancomycin resistance protein YoaR
VRDDVTPDGGRDTGRPVLRLVVALLVLAAGYTALAWFVGRHVPASTTVAGVPIGGMTPQRAEDTLRRALSGRADDPVRLAAGDRTVQLEPGDAGLALDFPGTVEGLSGFSLAPGDVWRSLTGGDEHRLRVSVDRSRLESALAAVGAQLATTKVEGAITFPGGKVAVVQPVAGRALSVERTADEVAARWPASGPVAAVLETSAPAVTAEEVARANREFATPAMSAPVEVRVGSRSFDVPPATYAPAVTMKADGEGRLVPTFDRAKLVAAVHAAAGRAGLERKARDASFTFRGDTVVVVPSADGVSLDESSVVSAFVPALTSRDRRATVKATVVHPALTTAEAARNKPREKISTFTTSFPYNPPRTENITIAARTLNGTYVPAGKGFSLNAVLGQRTAAKGYNPAPVIVNGRLTKDYGGGISQLSTTLFNAVFFSGARIEEHHPHSFYISRYPEGREATISWPDVDNRFTNDTGHGILIRAFVSGSSVTVSFYGTKVWDIEASKGPRRNVVQPRTIVDDKPSCVPQTPTPGFDVTVTRIFKKAGKTVKTSQFTTHYIPEDDVRCTHPSAG